MNSTPLYLHEKLLAYTVNLEFYRSARVITRQFPRGLADLADQLMRSSRTSCLAVAEGANSRSAKMKHCYFDRSLASNGESAACLDQVLVEEAAPTQMVADARALLDRATRLTLGLMTKR